MEPLISVIIPVYNTKDYLDQCLWSIQRQTLRDIEVIIIDDGSNDGSEKICEEYGKRDSRFRIWHQKNAGLAAARNRGIEQARADYIMWTDSDDWVEPTFCEEALKAATENRADIVVFRFTQHDEDDKESAEKIRPFPEEGMISPEKALTESWELISDVVWNKIYRRELYKDIQYPEGYLYEDRATTYQLVHAAERVCLTNQYLYHYRGQRTGSISNTRSLRRIQDYYRFSITRINDFKSWGYEIEEKEMKTALTYIAVMGSKGEFSTQCDRILRENKEIPEQVNGKHKAMIRLYRFSPRMFDLIAVLSGRRR